MQRLRQSPPEKEAPPAPAGLERSTTIQELEMTHHKPTLSKILMGFDADDDKTNDDLILSRLTIIMI
jgi:hypothetical protein